MLISNFNCSSLYLMPPTDVAVLQGRPSINRGAEGGGIGTGGNEASIGQSLR